MSNPDSLDRTYFESLYDSADDPWSFASSPYEAEKYDRSLFVLATRYVRALEIGCSIGVFTQRLAERCEDLFAIDISAQAVMRARDRCAGLEHVHVARAKFPSEGPDGEFDLITCCEVGYYWSDADLAAARDRIAGALVTGGDLLLVHFLPKVDDYVRDGDAVHEAFLADGRFRRVDRARAERYRLDLLQRC